MTERRLAPAAFPAAVFVACAFLLMPQAMLGQRTYAAVDLLETKAPYRDAIGRPAHVVSPIQTDQAESLANPTAFFRSLRHGAFQRWDPHVAGGQPVGILPLGGMFSPFSIGYLFLPTWYAVGLKTFLALVFSQGSTYLLLRRLGAAPGPAVLAGVAYTFSGTNLVLIHRVDAVFLLPALFWAVHRLVVGDRARATPARSTRRRAAVVAGLVAWAWFEGFPSGWVYCVYATAAWAAWLAVRRAAGAREVLRRGLYPAVAMLGGAALASVTLVPFLSEVLARGTLDIRANAAGAHLPSIQLFGLLDLSAIGPPLGGPWWSGLNPVESVSHVGMIVACAVAAGLLAASLGRVRLSRAGADAWPFFCALAAIGVLVNFLGTPLLTVLEHLPGVARNPIGRSRFLISLAAAVMAGLVLDAWWGRRGDDGVRASRLAAGVTLVALAAAPLLHVADFARAASAANRLRDVSTKFSIGLGLAVAAAGLAALGVRRRSARTRIAVTVALAGLLFVQLGWPLRHFTPEAPAEDFYGEQSGHRTLRALTGDTYRFTASDFQFYPNSGQALGLYDLRGVALYSRELKALVRAFNPEAFDADPLKVDLKRDQWNLGSPLLDDLSVRYFALGTDERPFGRPAGEADGSWDRWEPADAVGADAMSGVAPGPVSGVYLPLRATGACTGVSAALSLTSGGAAVASTTRTAVDLSAGGWTGYALVGTALSAGDPYRLAISTTSPRCHLELGMTGQRVARQLLVEDSGQPVRLVSTDQAWLYERPNAWPLVSVHRRWRAFPDQAQLLAWAANRAPGDADVAAFVRSGDAPAEPGPGPSPSVGYAEISDNSVRAETSGEATSLVVVSQNRAQGWKARVDGRAAPIVAVDGALMGVFVPPGRHTLVLSYLPPTFVVGSAVSALALLVGVLGCLLPREPAGARPGRGAARSSAAVGEGPQPFPGQARRPAS